MAKYQSVSPKGRGRSKRKNGAKSNMAGKNGKVKALKSQIDSVFCPECQGTGVKIEEDELEMPTIPLSEVCLLSLIVVVPLILMGISCLRYSILRMLEISEK